MACGQPIPSAGPYVGEKNGVKYFIDPDLNMTLETADLEMRLTVAAWGKEMKDVEGLSVVFTSRPFICQNNRNVDGCYLAGASGNEIFVLSQYPGCPYIAPLPHEVWHHLFSRNAEPTTEQMFEIQRVNNDVFVKMLGYCSLEDD